MPGLGKLANEFLKRDEDTSAFATTERILQVDPDNTYALGIQCAALRRLGRHDEANLWINFDDLLDSAILPPPRQYQSLATFNHALVKELNTYAVQEYNPVGISIRQGWKVSRLTERRHGAIPILLDGIKIAIQNYILKRQKSKHPFFDYTPATVTLDAWAGIQQNMGYESAHMHSFGWLSGVYYVKVPQVAETDKERSGCIEFGVDPYKSDAPGLSHQTRLIQPKNGLLLLFPSYFYHRTLVNKSKDQRIVIAFDVIPDRATQSL